MNKCQETNATRSAYVASACHIVDNELLRVADDDEFRSPRPPSHGRTHHIVVALNALLMQLAQPLNFLGGAYRITLQGVLDIAKMEDFLQRDPVLPLPGSASAKPFLFKHGRIELEDVVCRALQKPFSLVVEPGAKIGIVGPSGSGKSTILKLLCRLVEPESGRVLVDGQDITTLDPTTYPAPHVGVVPQEAILFNETIRYNLAYAASESDLETADSKLEIKLSEVLQTAQLHETLSDDSKFPQGYETKVGERGTRLSGGERQRLAIARCLLTDPEILLFDEATASLDLETEANVTAAINNLVTGLGEKDKTMLIVAHRLSTVKKCDTILYLEDGQIVESGSHEDLIELDGKYKRMWDMADVNYEPEGEPLYSGT